MKLNLFKKMMCVYQWLKLPAMTSVERTLFKFIIEEINKKKGFVNIFEYGSGFSTLYYSKFMRSNNIKFHIDSVDNHQGWHERIKSMVKEKDLSSNVSLHLHSFEPFWNKDGWDWEKSPAQGKYTPASQEEQAYVNQPKMLSKKFDIIFVDARFRRRCIEAAVSCLSNDGIIFLHDAERKHYHQPIESYKSSVFIDGGKYYIFEKNIHRSCVIGNSSIIVDKIKEEFEANIVT